ncbi:MAG: SpoIIE family protein phosphatase [Spirochaetaceae bacterium]|nr:SpoIIE family protein phosphatase [Spirochaetaceae bacterium]
MQAVMEGTRTVFNGTVLVAASLVLLVFALLAALIKMIAARIGDRAHSRAAAEALLSGDIMPGEKQRRARSAGHRGSGLSLKLAFFTIALMLLVVLMISLPLFAWISRNRREILYESLKTRSLVLVEGLAASAGDWLSQGGYPWQLERLSERGIIVPEARYLTITTIRPGSRSSGEVIWATNDPDILGKINTARFEPGVSLLNDALSPRVEAMVRELEWRAGGGRLAIMPGWMQETGTEPSWVSGIPDSGGNFVWDLASFTAALFSGSIEGTGVCIFYRPIVVRGDDGDRLGGIVRLEVSAEPISAELRWYQTSLLELIFTVAGAAIAIGITGALLLSSLIILPIRKLVSHVELIRDTENMASLEGAGITIKTRDEIALLGNTINDMTRALVRAAQASQDLTIGKELQKKFIPLDTDRTGSKLTTGCKETPLARFFGYYEGAKGVSGDYFDYLDLDGRYFAVIKCDVAGKGVPAALIMVQVATMFLNFFNNWDAGTEGTRIEKAVYQINEFIEALGFAGRFAAFSLCLFDSQTGLLRFCNAGDNVVHWFDASAGSMRELTLRETPAAGVLPNFLVDSRGGYTVETMHLDHGDMLFLYTDGIEEAKRKFRDEKYREIACAEPITGARGNHGNHRPGESVEELGRTRVEGIVNAVMNRETWSLHKYHNPEKDDELTFDFSSCAGAVEEAVLALVSAEKIFRIYRPRAGDGSQRVLTDRKVDGFLKKHFRQYGKYCSRQVEHAENSHYVYYTGVNEDPQYDDITILGILRK